MAQITLTVPDDKEQRFLNAFATVYNWDQAVDGTKRQFIKKKVKDYMREVLYRAEIATAQATASATLQADIDGITVD